MKTKMKTFQVFFSTTTPNATVFKVQVQATLPSVAIKKAYLSKGMKVEGSQVSATLMSDSLGIPYDVTMKKHPYTSYECSLKEVG